MPDIIIPSDEHSSYSQLVLTTTSDATANGTDTNSAIARLSRHDRPVCGETLSFNLSGSACFTQGGQQITATTDHRGEAKVYFTDTQQETVEVTCRYHQMQARESSHFIQAANSGMAISAEVLVNKAQANGIAQNRLLYTVYDVARMRIPNTRLEFETTGNAILSANAGQTDQNGQYTLNLTNTRSEQVLVSAVVSNEVGVNNYTLLGFTPFSPQYKIIAVVPAPVTAPGINVMQYFVRRVSDNSPVSGAIVNISASSSIQRLNDDPTVNGSVMIALSSSIPGTFRITASLEMEPLTINNTDLIWKASV